MSRLKQEDRGGLGLRAFFAFIGQKDCCRTQTGPPCASVSVECALPGGPRGSQGFRDLYIPTYIDFKHGSVAGFYRYTPIKYNTMYLCAAF